ncbi:MAG: sulfatase-like hydrolase/transferase, partial [Planctomycetota bacterium]
MPSDPTARPRPNVLWIMTDQHHADAMSCAGHPDVQTPNLDRIAARGVRFSRGYCNNPICSPSRICFITGRYMHDHRMFGNEHALWPEPNHDTLACLLRRHGYQTALIGKSHMTRRWDADGFEHIRYTDLCDADPNDPRTCHYFAQLDDLGLADAYEEGVPQAGHEHARDGSKPALLPYEHSIEKYTGDETLKFLRGRDTRRPFAVQMSFQRPHEPITPAPEDFDLYDPDKLTLPDSADDYFEHRLAGRPKFMTDYAEQGGIYPLADPDPKRLRRCLASYYALITAIDREIGRVLDELEADGELDNTVIFFHADHGDFAGDHGLFHKNFGIFESIHRIPYLLSWPGGPRGEVRSELVDSVDWYTTCCALCDVSVPAHLNLPGRVLSEPHEPHEPTDHTICEWQATRTKQKVSAIRTDTHRLVYHGDQIPGNIHGELYDHTTDPGETRNLWNDPEHAALQTRLMNRLFTFTLEYGCTTTMQDGNATLRRERFAPRNLIHQQQKAWSSLKQVYEEPT